MEHYKISKLLNDSTLSNFVTKKWVEINHLSSGQYYAKKNTKKELQCFIDVIIEMHMLF